MSPISIHPDTAATFKERPGLGIVLTVIANNIIEKEAKIKRLREEVLRDIEEWTKQRELLENFETLHKDELSNICPAYLEPLRRHCPVHPFLFGPINHIECLISGGLQILDTPESFHHELGNLCKIPSGFSEQISAEDLSRITGVSSKNIRALILELERRNLISRQRSIGPCFYKITENIYLERAKTIACQTETSKHGITVIQ